MRVPVEVQIWRFSVLFIVGAATDLLFQSFRAFRAVFRPKRLGYHLLDALVAVILLTGLGATVFIINWGELRMYVPLSIALGAFITHAAVGGVCYRKAFRAFTGTKKGLAWGHRHIVAPTRAAVGRTVRHVRETIFRPDAPDAPDPTDPTDPPEPPEPPISPGPSGPPAGPPG